ncbi:MAG: ADP-glyceromanno-heptose 6-epimerase [Chlamydiota bacterium]
MNKEYRKSPRREQGWIVVTGAAGFIGSGVVRYLNDLGYTQLLLVDTLEKTDKWKNLVGKSFMDLVTKEALFPILEEEHRNIRGIVHLGACSSTTETDGDYLLENNYRYSVDLAKAAIRWNIRFVYASSAATYGGREKNFDDDETALLELAPLNLYGFSKQLFDLWLERENLLDRVVGLKYFNVFGPNEYHKGAMASMVLKMTKKAAQGQPILLFKSNDPQYQNGEQKRDFIYVKDAVRCTVDFLLEPSLQDVGGIFNIGSGKATSWNQLAHALFYALDKPAKIEYIDMPKELEGQYQNFTQANMGKHQKLPHREPLQMTSIEESVREYVQQYILPGTYW